MDRNKLLSEIRGLNLPAGAYVVVGGAAMAIRGLRDTEDVDLVVTPPLFAELERSGWRRKQRPGGKPGLLRGPFEAYLDVNTQSFQRSTAWLLERAEFVEGIPLVDLGTLAGFKASYGRPKDLADLELLKTHLAEESGAVPAAQQPHAADRDKRSGISRTERRRLFRQGRI